MKKFITTILLFSCLLPAFSQSRINKGDWMAGGNAAFSFRKEGDFKSTSIELAPGGAYFFARNIAAGLRPVLSYSKSDFVLTGSRQSAFQLAPFLRYYLFPAAQKINLFAEGAAGFGEQKTESGPAESKTKFTQFRLQAGPAIFITPFTALEFALRFSSSKYNNSDDWVNIASLNIGFQVHLPGKRK